jgi:sulfonate transport system substrate-binding protein
MTRIASTKRRSLLGFLFVIAVAATPVPAFTADPNGAKELRIGFQKYGTLVILKAKGALEQRLAPLGVSVKWTEFPFGPPLLEAINVGSIDLGTVGEAPPIFALAAGADLVYVGNEPPAPAAEGILVPKDSPLKTVADLKGKKVAFAKGSNVNYFVVKVLESAGLKFSDIQPVHLAPADARAAFERGSVDAWGIWDPYLAAGQTQLGARVLADGHGVVNNYQFYLASRAYAEKHPEIVRIVVEELAKVDEWGKNNPKEVAALLAPQIGLDVATAEIAANRYSYGVKPVTDAVLADQQKVADTFYELKLIPRKINVRDAAWDPARAKVARESSK